MASRQTSQNMGGAFLDALGLRSDFRGPMRQHVGALYDQISWVLPEPDFWAAPIHGDDSELLLLADNALIAVGCTTTEERDTYLTVTCNPARVTAVTYRRDERQTHWHFTFKDRDPLELIGEMDHHYDRTTPEPFDQVEVFARALAGKAGWQIGGDDAD